MSDSIKHECGIALIRLLKPLDFYKKKIWNKNICIKQNVFNDAKTGKQGSRWSRFS